MGPQLRPHSDGTSMASRRIGDWDEADAKRVCLTASASRSWTSPRVASESGQWTETSSERRPSRRGRRRCDARLRRASARGCWPHEPRAAARAREEFQRPGHALWTSTVCRSARASFRDAPADRARAAEQPDCQPGPRGIGSPPAAGRVAGTQVRRRPDSSLWAGIERAARASAKPTTPGGPRRSSSSARCTPRCCGFGASREATPQDRVGRRALAVAASTARHP